VEGEKCFAFVKNGVPHGRIENAPLRPGHQAPGRLVLGYMAMSVQETRHRREDTFTPRKVIADNSDDSAEDKGFRKMVGFESFLRDLMRHH
jgi:hypothetical protein